MNKKRIIGSRTNTIISIKIGKYVLTFSEVLEEYKTVKDLLNSLTNSQKTS